MCKITSRANGEEGRARGEGISASPFSEPAAARHRARSLMPGTGKTLRTHKYPVSELFSSLSPRTDGKLWGQGPDTLGTSTGVEAGKTKTNEHEEEKDEVRE